jgi:hypothetical protein
MEISFGLPLGDAHVLPIRTRGRVVHSERLAQDEFHVGVQFIDLAKSVSEPIEIYINHLLETDAI